MGILESRLIFRWHLQKFSSPRPTYRIGSSIWPSGFLLAKALAEGAKTWSFFMDENSQDGFISTFPCEKRFVIMFDLLISAVFQMVKIRILMVHCGRSLKTRHRMCFTHFGIWEKTMFFFARQKHGRF